MPVANKAGNQGHRFNINSPKQLGDVLFNKMHLPKPMKYGRGKVVSTAVDVLEELAEHNEVPRQRGMEESPGSTGIRCRLTAGGGDPRESATESKPPMAGPRARTGKGETVR